MPVIRLAETDDDLRACYPVMHELRTLLDAEQFLEQVKLQMREGYRLVFAADQGRVLAAAGYRVLHFLAWGRVLYVDDLVTSAAQRGRGLGTQLIAWLIDEARRLGCQQLHLDSGVQRDAAHRFYKARGLAHNCHHFALSL